MKTINFIFIFLFIVGCNNSENKNIEKTDCSEAFYGDSIGVQLRDSVYAPEFDYFVTRGLKITELEFLDSSYCKIYLELGTNIDWVQGKEVEELALLNLITGIEDKVICVLPMTQHGEFYHMRGMMLEHCKNIIDPIQEGVYPLANDGTHLSWGTDNYNIKQYTDLFK